MKDFLEWLSSNEQILIAIEVSLIALAVSISLIYLIAFFQGRPISFWPPKIGRKSMESSDGIDGSLPDLNELPDLPAPPYYDSTYPNEPERLIVQGYRNSSLDYKSFEIALERLVKKDGIVALDVGCADGTITMDRFDHFDVFKKVIGIDNNPKAINRAKKKCNDKYTFKLIDAETVDFIESIKCEGLNTQEGFDFIFVSMTLHHLTDKEGFLWRLKDALRDNGVLVIRSIDDGLRICYPDPKGIFRKIIEVSSKESDRTNGRKLYTLLKNAGYKDIEFEYKVADTLNLSPQQRLDFFSEAFSYRPMHIEKQIELGDRNLLPIYEWLTRALSYLERRFYSEESLYYMQVQFVSIATK